eukprot:CAMPEP_0175077848 /NCGR_PEP_ID=MMETSP0052_2-20121109/23696_1 /TAXON_ID=51329 ORGANISM="Polytomella parva, Strain SAG 63-3" /NCGR_SAMPLE_ID=MMETSP0052_2 /ASSEMBLY_ACC=CAM_ASM_000194 /LENGTH=271 /DNA_ID=CAMNT_0016347515 /DNA_START=95 /DNA_END=907 /DNA_ORIENTATION=-
MKNLLLFPPSLTSRQRAILHGVCENNKLYHLSEGDGINRFIKIGYESGKKVDIEKGPLSDDDLCKLLETHFSIDASHNFTTAAPYPSHSDSPTVKMGLMTVDEFVKVTDSLLELERQDEVQQATDLISKLTPEAAQLRGNSLLNLRVESMETGLLGRTLVTLISGKGFGSGISTPELPPHQFGPHDIVSLHSSKGWGGGGGGSGGTDRPIGTNGGGGSHGSTLASGVIYRVREKSIVVALDDTPEDDSLLEGPLRLNKMANETTFRRYRDT